MPRTGHCARHCRMIRVLKSSTTAATVADRRDGISRIAEYGRTLISAYDETDLRSLVQRHQWPGRVLLDGRHRFSIASLPGLYCGQIEHPDTPRSTAI